MESSKRLKIFLSCITLGPLLGFLLTSLWFAGGNTVWKQVDYFPYPVESILTLQPYGNEFWVTTAENETYHILYPCEGTDACWEPVDTVPDVAPSDKYTVSDNKCESDYFITPLFRTIKTCVSSTIFAEASSDGTANTGENPWRVSLAVTSDNELWIWQNPWDFANRVIAFQVFFTFIGLSIGLIVDTLVTRKTG
ncbi:MAG: hypothetical protein IPO22_16575 [Anaerolineales bacterium]|nr:hypothetical protein [Anaerolineales bacterium]